MIGIEEKEETAVANLAIVVHSERGHTRALAEHIAAGIERVEGASAETFELSGAQMQGGRWRDQEMMRTLRSADSIIFGSPTYMGGETAIMKAFLDSSFDPDWLEQRWKNKIAGGFTNSSSQSGDKLSTLMQFALTAFQHGMIWVGVADFPGNNRSTGSVDDINRLGSWIGSMAQSNGDQGPELTPSAGDRETAERYGLRLAQCTRQWLGEQRYEVERLKYADPKRQRSATWPL
ncbi:MAG: flavodoxin family protein [Alphaproteobacteria bacterium]|nr:flavodoxin family protein [Alphaproteobacteria bacterium]